MSLVPHLAKSVSEATVSTWFKMIGDHVGSRTKCCASCETEQSQRRSSLRRPSGHLDQISPKKAAPSKSKRQACGDQPGRRRQRPADKNPQSPKPREFAGVCARQRPSATVEDAAIRQESHAEGQAHAVIRSPHRRDRTCDEGRRGPRPRRRGDNRGKKPQPPAHVRAFRPPRTPPRGSAIKMTRLAPDHRRSVFLKESQTPPRYC